MSFKWISELKKLSYIKKLIGLACFFFAVNKISSVKKTFIETNDCNIDCEENMCNVSSGCTLITTGKNSVGLEYWLMNLK